MVEPRQCSIEGKSWLRGEQKKILITGKEYEKKLMLIEYCSPVMLGKRDLIRLNLDSQSAASMVSLKKNLV